MSKRIFQRLLSYGYFPRELPPTFSSRRYGVLVARGWAGCPPAYSDTNLSASPARHSLVRSGSLRRQLSLPNPVVFPQIAEVVAENWPKLEIATQSSTISRSRPVLHRRGARCFLPLVPKQGDLVPIRAAARAGARILLTTDIARFYHSIYTHSIPWALHGKAVAKRSRRDYSLFGNRLDRALRNSSAGQTIGIPIGPDTSLVVAEVILAQIDFQLTSRFPKQRMLRYVDEFEIRLGSYDEAEDAIAALQRFLIEYELELNGLKTRIEPLPARHELSWVSEIRGREIRDSLVGQATDLVALFDVAFEEAQRRPEAPVLRYLMGRLKSQKVKLPNWRLLQHLLLECITVEPATIQGAMTIVLPHLAENFGLERGAFSSTLNGILKYHAPLGHGNEVAWALWTLLTLKLKVDLEAVRALEKMTDPCVAILAMHGETLGLLEDSLDKSAWVALAVKQSLYDENWLLAYEAVMRGWLPVNPGFIRNDRGFGLLADLDVRFYIPEAIEDPTPTGIPPSIGFGASFYP
jgi:Reverse transcriptase (RNA-dependent DNA polymerase)